MREEFGPEVRFRPIQTERRGFLRRRLGIAADHGDPVGLVDRALGVIEDRLMWDRFGL